MVSVGPADGKTFLGMVVRNDEQESHEFLSQALELPLEGGKCYEFSIYLAQSTTYMGLRSPVGYTDSVVFSRPFMTPAVLRIWGGQSICAKDELLGDSGPVDNNQWKVFNFRFEPEKTLRYFTLEAFYEVPVLTPYNGHILVDRASTIVEVPCEEDAPALVIEEPDEEIPGPEIVQQAAAPPPPPPPPSPEPKPEPEVEEEPEQPKPTILTELDRKKLNAGQTIPIKNLYFPADSSKIQPQSYPVLDEIKRFLISNPDIIIEIGGHTNTIPPDSYCDQLSEARAKAVTEYLIANGVAPEQLEYRGYGRRKPLIPDDKYSRAAQKKNQRVEIKVLKVDG
jgi:outer membrane protein OmpA-like peptidoglycan-associated protein